MKNLKVFWAVVFTFVMAALLILSTPFIGIGQTGLLWLGIAFCFGSYAGCSGIPSVLTSRQMPKGSAYTASYPKMLTIVIMSWILFLMATGALILIWKNDEGILNNNDAQSFLFQGFVFAATITGIFAGVKKLNSAAKESGPASGAG